MIALVCGDARTADGLAPTVASVWGDPLRLGSVAELARTSAVHDVVVLGPDVDLEAATGLATSHRAAGSRVAVVLVRQRVDSAVLTAALQSGVFDVVAAAEPARLRGACASALELAARPRETADGTATGGRGRVLDFFGGKGGVGTTTIAVSTALMLAERCRVCLIDLDLAFGDVAMALRLFPERTLGNAVGMGDTLDAAGVGSLVVRHPSGLHALLAPTSPSQAEHVSGDLVARLVDVTAGLYDAVVVDTPSAFTDPVLASLDAADEVLLVTTPDVSSAKNHKLVERTLDALALPADRRRAVLNRSGTPTGLTDADLRTLLGARPAAHVPSSPPLAVAANQGRTIRDVAPRDPAVRALRSLADELLPGPPGPAAVVADGGRRVWARRRPAGVAT